MRRSKKKREINRSARKKFLFSSSSLLDSLAFRSLLVASVRNIIYDSSTDGDDEISLLRTWQWRVQGLPRKIRKFHAMID